MKKLKYFLFIIFLFSLNLSLVHAVSYLVECDYSISYNGDIYAFEIVIDNDQNVHYNWEQEVSVNGQFFVYYDAGEKQFFTDFYNLIYPDGDAVDACPILYKRIETYKKFNDNDKWMHFDWHQNFKYLGDKVFSGGSNIGTQTLNPSAPSSSFHKIHVTDVTTKSSSNSNEGNGEANTSEKPNESSGEANTSEKSNENSGEDPNFGVQNIDSAEIDCSSIFGPEDNRNELYHALQDIFNLLKFAAPILLIVLSTIDYIKAITSHDAEGLKKANEKFVKRLAIGVAIFMLPFILDFIFEVFGVYDIQTCGIGK